MKPHFFAHTGLAAALTGLLGLALTGCAVGPDYQKPELPLPDAWQAPLPHGGQLARMADWWSQFNDPVLTALQKTAQEDSPDLASAVAAIKSARASVTTNRASGLPTLSADGSVTRSGDLSGKTAAGTVRTGGLDASWEVDVFGGVRRSVESAQATLQAKQAAWHDARISLDAEVASDYVDYRACQLTLAAYQEQAESYQKTLRATRLSVQAGFSAPSDLMLAQAGAASASSSAIAQQATCDVDVKTLVAATGMPEKKLRELLGDKVVDLPMPAQLGVESVPATLINQRPDVMSSERQLASYMAKIGVAEANRWPTFSITGSIASTNTNGVLTQPWSLVPALSVPLFQSGALSAKVTSAEADYESALASYKSTVRSAIKEVEQALVNLDSVARREADANTSAEQYRNYFKASEINWQAGFSSLLDLETARRSWLSAEISLIELKQTRVSQWVTLYKALGGGWQTAAAVPEQVSAQGEKQ